MDEQKASNRHASPRIARQPEFVKVTDPRTVNLSSNELLHPALAGLFREFLDATATPSIARYPTVSDAARTFEDERGLRAGSVVLAPGSDPALRAVIEALGHSRRLVSTTPAYRAYAEYADAFDMRFLGVDVVRGPQERFVEELSQAVHRMSPCLVIIANPDATTGVRWGEDAIRRVAGHARQSDSMLVLDEAYAGFADAAAEISHSTVDDAVVVRSLSKSHGAAGLRIASVQAAPEVVRHVAKTRMSNGVSYLGLEFLRFSMRRAEAFRRLRSDVVAWRESFLDKARRLRPGWRIPPSSANFAFIDMVRASEARRVRAALEQAGLRPRWFDGEAGLEHCLRLTIAPPEVMAGVLNCFGEGV